MGSGRNLRFLPAIAVLVGILAAAALPGVAQAHHEPSIAYQGPVTAAAPDVDGVLGEGEWADVPSYFVLFGELSGTVRFQHDSQYLYVALTVADSGIGAKSASIRFDDDHDGIKDPGEDTMIAFVGPGNTGQDFYFSAAGTGGASHYNDFGASGGSDPPGDGTIDVIAGGTEVGGQVTLEYRHTLCSTDDVHDFCLAPGDTVGLTFQYQSGGPFWTYPLGSSGLDPSDWADLTLAAAAPPSGRIVFETTRDDGNQEIYRMNADGSAQTRLTNAEGYDGLPSISPDGRRVAFTSDREGGNLDLYVMNIDGSGVTRLTTQPGVDQQPAWSPDGTKIAYSRRSIEGNFEIVVLNTLTGAETNVSDSPSSDDGGASWSPDGEQIAFSTSLDGNNELFRASSNGAGEPTRLTTNTADDHDPDWSPDGEKLAFYSDRPSQSCCGSVWTINASDGSGAANLTNAFIFDADPSWSPDGTHIAFVRDLGGQNFHTFTALADGTGQVRLTTLGNRNSFPDWGPIATADPSATISITGPESSEPGAVSAPIADITLDAIRGETGSTSATPLGGIPLGGIPLGGIPLGGIPLGGIPLGGIGFTPENLNQNGLGGVPLSTIPLVLPDKWEAHLALAPAFAGTPPQNVTLAQVLNTDVVAGVTLDDLNLASSPLGGIPLGGIALGGLPLGGIPLPGPGSTLEKWCAYVNEQPGFNCPNGVTIDAQTTMLGIALQGVPLGGIPLGGIPLGGIPLGGIPLGGIPVGTPLGGIPLGGIDLTGTPLGGIPLGGINMSVSPLGGIPLGGIPLSAKNAILNCPTGNFICAPTDTLGAAHAAGAIKSTATLQDLGYYKNASGQDIKLAELVVGLPADTTLEDLLATVLLRTAYDWEELPLQTFPLQDFSSDGATSDYSVSFTVSDVDGSTNGLVGVHLPPQARYVPDSTQLSGEPGSVGEPTLLPAENELTWAVTGIAPGTTYTLDFQAKPGLSLGTESATAKIDATGVDGTVLAPDPANTAITEPGEPGNGDTESAQAIQSDTLYLGYTSSGSDKDFFQITAAPGEQLTIHLSHLQVDDDLVVYGPTIAPLRTPHPGAIQPVSGDVPFDLEQRTQAITPEALADVPQAATGQPVLDVSDNRGLADEEVAVVSPEGGTYTIQVSSFDGGFSNDPWMLRVERSPAIPLPATCTNPPATGGGVTKPMPVVPPTANTLYLFASKRFGDLYGLHGRERRLGQAADPREPQRRRGRRRDPGRRERRCADRAQQPRHRLVLTGEGKCRRPGRRRAARQPADRAAVGQAHRRRRRRHGAPVRARPRQHLIRERARLREHLLRHLEQPVPEHVRARAPADRRPARRRQLRRTRPVRAGARARPPRRDAGADHEPGRPVRLPERGDRSDQGVDHGLRLPQGRRDEDLDGLQGEDGRRQRDGADQRHVVEEQPGGRHVPDFERASIVSLNAHYDHFRSLPADENAAHRETILFTTADLLTRSTSGRVVFTMGCHSALPVSDFVVGDVLKPDWAQSYAQTGAVVYMGNTGFGLGDTAAVLYSEKLNVLFAERLDGTMTVGQALAFAKQEYAATPTLSGYHLKVIDQASMMGLPMYRVGTAGIAPPPNPAITSTDSATGLPTASFNISPTLHTGQHLHRRLLPSPTTPSPRTAARSSRRRSATSRSRASWPTAQ